MTEGKTVRFSRLLDGSGGVSGANRTTHIGMTLNEYYQRRFEEMAVGFLVLDRFAEERCPTPVLSRWQRFINRFNYRVAALRERLALWLAPWLGQDMRVD